MVFTSLIFVIYLPIVFIIYWLLHKRLQLQNGFIVLASYVFYGWWDWRFLAIIAFTTLWTYFMGILDFHEYRGRKIRLILSLIVNLGILGIFKYYNFFMEQMADFLQNAGISVNYTSLKIILPVGISFYTFQALSYTVDVYRRDITATRDIIAFFAYISFFPQLVAGPIERATQLLPQFHKTRNFDYALAVFGCRLMLWGAFKKMIVADRCAEAVNYLLAIEAPIGISLWAAMIMFAFQIYGDFSGYSDIAIGCSKLFGFDLMKNFNHPYFSTNISEFWRRWHISLNTWFRDYLYIPLGGSRHGMWKTIRNTYAIFLTSGLWHGANWTFVAWGAFHATCFIPGMLKKKYFSKYKAPDNTEPGKNNKMLSEIKYCFNCIITFVAVVIGWTFFRAPNISSALKWIQKMLFDYSTDFHGAGLRILSVCILPVLALIVIESFNLSYDYPRLPRNRILRWIIYCMMSILIIYFRLPAQKFIYFQF